MKVTVVGGWSKIRRENKSWGLENHRQLVAACRAIGRRLAEQGHALVVGSDQCNSVDPYVVEGYLSEAERKKKESEEVPLIQVIEGIDGEGKLYARDRRSRKRWRFFLGSSSPLSGRKPRAAEKILSVRDSDALIAIGGLNDTYIAGTAAMVARKQVVPFATFGGAARQLWQMFPLLRCEASEDDDFKRLAGRIWDDDLIDAGLRFGGLDRPQVFLGSSGNAQASALELEAMLERLGCNVVYWEHDFRLGRKILDQLLEASTKCKYAILLLTPHPSLSGDGARRFPSANLLFELGFFLNALGQERTLAILQAGTEVPDDYAGQIYVPFRAGGGMGDVEPYLRRFLGKDPR